MRRVLGLLPAVPLPVRKAYVVCSVLLPDPAHQDFNIVFFFSTTALLLLPLVLGAGRLVFLCFPCASSLARYVSFENTIPSLPHLLFSIWSAKNIQGLLFPSLSFSSLFSFSPKTFKGPLSVPGRSSVFPDSDPQRAAFRTPPSPCLFFERIVVEGKKSRNFLARRPTFCF